MKTKLVVSCLVGLAIGVGVGANEGYRAVNDLGHPDRLNWEEVPGQYQFVVVGESGFPYACVEKPVVMAQYRTWVPENNQECYDMGLKVGKVEVGDWTHAIWHRP